MRGRARECTPLPPRSWQLLAAHLFATAVELDEGHAGAPTIKDYDWLEVDDQLAELGDVASTTAPAPTRRLDVTQLW